MKYEYNQTYLSFKDGLNHLETLNMLGNNGWEIISSTKIDEHNIMYLFKRELRETKTLLKEGAKINE